MLAVCRYQSLRQSSTFCSCTSRNTRIIPSFISYNFSFLFTVLSVGLHIYLSYPLYPHLFLLLSCTFSISSSLSPSLFSLSLRCYIPSALNCIVHISFLPSIWYVTLWPVAWNFLYLSTKGSTFTTIKIQFLNRNPEYYLTECKRNFEIHTLCGQR